MYEVDHDRLDPRPVLDRSVHPGRGIRRSAHPAPAPPRGQLVLAHADGDRGQVEHLAAGQADLGRAGQSRPAPPPTRRGVAWRGAAPHQARRLAARSGRHDRSGRRACARTCPAETSGWACPARRRTAASRSSATWRPPAAPDPRSARPAAQYEPATRPPGRRVPHTLASAQERYAAMRKEIKADAPTIPRQSDSTVWIRSWRPAML